MYKGPVDLQKMFTVLYKGMKVTITL